MTADGRFQDVPPVRSGFLVKLGVAGAVLAVLGSLFVVAALALWVAVSLLPVILGAAAIGWLALNLRPRRPG